MKTNIARSFAPLLSLMTVFAGTPGLAQPQFAADTNVYSIYPFAGSDDDGTTMYWYADYCMGNRDLMARGLSGPLPEQLPASRDINGHWGAVVDRLQLSVRFHRREFLQDELVSAMILLRNLGLTSRTIAFRSYGKSQTRKKFAFVLRNGTNVTNWSWTDPPPPDPPPNGYRLPRDFAPYTMDPHSQAAFFVRLDEIFDLKRLGEYSVQVSCTERLSSGVGTTNIVSGAATFRIVDKLSPEEVAATNAFARNLQETQRKAGEILQKALHETKWDEKGEPIRPK